MLTPAELAAVDLMQENLLAYFRVFAGLPGVTVATDSDVVWSINEGGPPGNHVLWTRLTEATVERRIDEILGQIGRHTDRLDWLVFPACRPLDLGPRLAARGLIGGPGGTWMLADLTAPAAEVPPPDGWRVEVVRDEAMLALWTRLSGEGFGGDVQIFHDAYARHGFRPEAASSRFIGYARDEPVTSATLSLAGGIAGLFDVSTPPGFRRRGYGDAITRALMRAARQRGFRQMWTWASAMGKSVYQRAGFIAADFGIREYRWSERG